MWTLLSWFVLLPVSGWFLSFCLGPVRFSCFQGTVGSSGNEVNTCFVLLLLARSHAGVYCLRQLVKRSIRRRLRHLALLKRWLIRFSQVRPLFEHDRLSNLWWSVAWNFCVSNDCADLRRKARLVCFERRAMLNHAGLVRFWDLQLISSRRLGQQAACHLLKVLAWESHICNEVVFFFLMGGFRLISLRFLLLVCGARFGGGLILRVGWR